MTAGRKALVPFITAGYPDKARCLQYLKAFAEAGADAIELGIPFSDPLADGAVIQQTSQHALERGTTVRDALELARRFAAWRGKKRATRLFLMTYLNPVLAYGVERFMADARAAGAAGVIPVDLIPEEGEAVSKAAASAGLEVTYLCSPTCTPERMRRIGEESTGFVYLVSVKGVTGARASVPAGLDETVARLRAATSRSIYVGFGISGPRQAAAVARLADGVVVGSALLKLIPPNGKDRTSAVRAFLGGLRRAIDRAG
jgi:tryptophan synthase alpha chain